MNRFFQKALCAFLCIVTMAGLMTALPHKAQAAHYTGYSTVAIIKNQGDCYAMQGCDSDDNYIYCTKVNTETETSCVIARVHKDTGATTFLTNSATGGIYFSQLSHANDLDVVDINGVKTVFVATGGAGEGPYSLVRFVLEGTTLTEVAHYDMKVDGASHRIAGAQVMSVEGDNINMVFLWGKYVYMGTIGVNQQSSAAVMEHVITLDLANVTMNGSKKDLSDWTKQGFEYYDGKIYVPLTANHQDSTSHISSITAWDVVGASGTIKNNPNFSVWVEDTTYPNLFEIESCTICPTDGKMYFSTNSRKSSSDGNWDGVHYIRNYTYDPSLGDDSAAANYRWNITGGTLFSSNQDGAVFNYAKIIKGTISGNAITGGQYSLERTVTLNHSTPWVVEWKASNVKNAMLMSTTKKSGYNGNMYLYVRKDGLVSMGTAIDGTYHNYGINITNHGLNTTDEHTYRIENRIAADGSNMAYLLVDGKELGAMNGYFVGGTAQGSTNNWISGKDFKFSYLGTTQHPLNGNYTNIKVWGNGRPGQMDEPNTLRWETTGNALNYVEQFDHTNSPVTALFGSISGTNCSGYQGKLSKNVTLLHDKPWSLEWKGNASGMLVASAPYARTERASFLYRSSVVALGRWDGTKFQNYGVSLADYGIDPSISHTYRLTNRVNADGSNMVYLYVDGKEIAPMDTCFIGTTQQNTGSNWVSGKDFSFGYFGTYQFPMAGELSYIQVWEDGIPADQRPNQYYWTPGTNTMTPSTAAPCTDNKTVLLGGSNTGTTMNDSWYRMKQSVVLLHDRNWSVKWESEGSWYGSSTGAFLLSASQYTNEINAPYLYRRSNSDLIAFGVRLNGTHNNYGVCLADHGIDGTAKHTYELVNRISTDGSNMVYLYVDGQEIAPMNTYFKGGTNSGATDNWISGKDFVFSYMGTPRFPIGGCKLSYLQVSEGCTHSYKSAVTTAPTCQTTGITTYTCSICGDSYTETIPSTGHSYNAAVTAPTCTADGYTTYTCACGDFYVADEIFATGHNFERGKCTACGDADPDFIPVTLTGKSFSLSIEDEILVNFYYAVTGETVAPENLGMLVFYSQPASISIDKADEVYEGSTYSSTGGYYLNTTKGIAAKLMGDNRYYVAYAKLENGSYAYSTAYQYSPRKYADNMLSRASTSQNQKALCVAMLNYGAAAQEYFGYKTDSLMNADLTAEQQAMVVDYSSSLFKGAIPPDSSKVGDFVRTATGFSSRSATLSLDGAFAINYYFTPSETVDDVVTFYYWTADDYAAASTLKTSNATGKTIMQKTAGGSYWGQVTGIAAKQLDDTYYVAAVYTSNTQMHCTGVIAYSLSRYCMSNASGTGTLAKLAAATAVYGYHAKTYFTK